MNQAERPDVFSAGDVEEAIALGLEELGLRREQVEVEVLDKGSRGIFGIGGRPALVRLTAVSAPAPAPETAVRPERPLAPERVEAAPPSIRAEASEVARSVLAELLERLGFSADIRISQAEPSADEEEGPLVLDVYGEGVASLIGRRGETLAGLQRIVRLMVGRRMDERVNLVVDVEGYKREREQKLRRLAEQMAERAVKDDRTISLEPMPAYERRIVHIALRDRPDVVTESVGAGNRRRVTIVPQRG